MKRLVLLAMLAAPVTASAQEVWSGADAWDGSGPTPGELGNPVIGAPLGANDPPRRAEQQAMAPEEPGPPLQLTDLRRRLIGKPVHGPGSGRIGEVSDVVVGGDERVTNITVQIDKRLDPDRAHLPVPWSWVRFQLEQPTIVVPWDPAMVAWLTEPGRSRRTKLDPPPPEAERRSWEQAAAARLEDWRARIDASTQGVAEPDTALRQLQLSFSAARSRHERLVEAEPEAWPLEQAKLQAQLDELDRSWSELAEARER